MTKDLLAIPARDFKVLGTGQVVIRSQRSSGLVDRRRQAPQAVLLTLVAAGLLWGNVLLFRFLDFPVTLTILLTAGLFIFGIGNWIGQLYKTSRLLLPALALLLYEFISHGLFAAGIDHFQWPQSFALLAMCTGVLIVSSQFQISASQLPTLAKGVSWIAYLMGGLGIVQFIAANTFGYVWNPLPNVIALGRTVAETDAIRFGGLFRANGISSESSYYGMGMVMLTALCFTLLSLTPPNHKSNFFRRGALFMAMGGVFASVSFAAWGVLVIVLSLYIANNFDFVFHYKKTLLISLVLIIAVVVIVGPFLQERILNILRSEDSSANYRLQVAIDLIISPADDLLSTLLGTGVGMDSSNSKVVKTFEKYLSLDYLTWVIGSRNRLVIVSGWAYIVITMGWIGLALNWWLLAAAFQGQCRNSFPRIPLFALSVGYLFAIGSYLSPEWWAWLVLASVLKRVQTQ